MAFAGLLAQLPLTEPTASLGDLWLQRKADHAHGMHMGELRDDEQLVELYPFWSAVPTALWWDLLNRAQQQIGVLVYAANFLHEQYPTVTDLFREKAGAGCKVRIALGDPRQ